MKIGEIVRQVFRKSGLSIEDLERELGKSERSIYQLFTSDNIKFKELQKLSRLLQYDFGKHVFSEESVTEEKLQEPASHYQTSLNRPLRIVMEIDSRAINDKRTQAFINRMNNAVEEFEHYYEDLHRKDLDEDD